VAGGRRGAGRRHHRNSAARAGGGAGRGGGGWLGGRRWRGRAGGGGRRRCREDRPDPNRSEAVGGGRQGGGHGAAGAMRARGAGGARPPCVGRGADPRPLLFLCFLFEHSDEPNRKTPGGGRACTGRAFSYCTDKPTAASARAREKSFRSAESRATRSTETANGPSPPPRPGVGRRWPGPTKPAGNRRVGHWGAVGMVKRFRPLHRREKGARPGRANPGTIGRAGGGEDVPAMRIPPDKKTTAHRAR